MTLPRRDPYLWIHLAGLATVPLWLDLCLSGLAVGDPVAPPWLELTTLGWVGTVPILWMQLQRPFYIFSIPGLAVRPDKLGEDRRRLLTRQRTWMSRGLVCLSAIALLLILYWLYQLAPMAADMTPFAAKSRPEGWLICAVSFFFANLFMQVPATVLPLLLTSPKTLEQTTPYDSVAILKRFMVVGIRVPVILPDLAVDTGRQVPSPPTSGPAASTTATAEIEPTSTSVSELQAPSPKVANQPSGSEGETGDGGLVAEAETSVQAGLDAFEPEKERDGESYAAILDATDSVVEHNPDFAPSVHEMTPQISAVHTSFEEPPFMDSATAQGEPAEASNGDGEEADTAVVADKSASLMEVGAFEMENRPAAPEANQEVGITMPAKGLSADSGEGDHAQGTSAIPVAAEGFADESDSELVASAIAHLAPEEEPPNRTDPVSQPFTDIAVEEDEISAEDISPEAEADTEHSEDHANGRSAAIESVFHEDK